MKYKAGSRRRAAEYEKALVEWWKKNRVFERSVEQRPIDQSYVFYDGPPFITGMPHHGTLLSSIVKDAVPRYWTMRGKRVERRWGWDCHGLPAENFVEKQLGIKDRREIGTKWSLEEYILKARESMVANSETWEGTIERIGRWVNFRGAYRTMDKDFMESVWWAFKTLYEKGKIYEGRKVLMYDTKFATPVSKSEVTMDNDAYQTVTDPSAYVRFKLTEVSARQFCSDTLKAARPSLGSEQNVAADPAQAQPEHAPQRADSAADPAQAQPVYLLAWTTTPWTLPANLALAVKPELEYAAVRVSGEEGVMILAASLLEKVLKGAEYEVVRTGIKGAELVGLEYEPLFKNLEQVEPESYHVLAAEFVSDTEGTGIVHIAPAYGEDDYALAQGHQVGFADVLDENGYYLPEMAEQLHELGVRDTDEHGIEVWAGNKFIAKCLEEAGVVWKIEYIQHEYPFNPRSKQRIIYRAFPSWFFDVQGSKPLMLEENEKINWFPGYLKHGRFAKNIEQAPDWNLSRDRFWATAMPVWKGDKGTVKVVGSYDELFELSGVRLEDYHRPWVDEIEFEIDGEHFRRIPKVLDCWFESGSMPFAQLHYPFENKEKFERNYPADFIVEYVGQVRAWFYYVHCVNTALFGRNAYKNVITTGTLAGNDGRKMSKSLGNYTDPNELMDKYSADALRFLLLSSPVLSGEDFALTDKDVSDVQRKLMMIWNVYDFFVTYAEVDNWEAPENLFSSEPAGQHFASSRGPLRSRPSLRGSLASASPVGSHVLAKTQSTGDPQRAGSSGALAHLSPQGLKNPLDRWVVSRLNELNQAIVEGMEEYNLPKALSGVLPFVDDLSNWFVRRSRRRFWKSEDDGDKAEAYLTLYTVLTRLAILLAPFTPFLAEELYQQMTGSGESVHLLDYPMETEVDEKVLDEMARARKVIADGLAFRMQKSETEEQIKIRQPLNRLVYAGEKLPEMYEQIIAEEVNVKAVENGAETWLDKELTAELREEGWVRDLIRAVQAARKKAGLQVDDRIRLSLGVKVPEQWRGVLMNEVLATELGQEGNYEYDEIAKVGGENVVISLEKVG